MTLIGPGGDAVNENVYDDAIVARHPIFDRDLNIWGYELLFRNSRDVNRAEIADSNSATAQVIIDGIALARQGIPPDRSVMINFSRDLLVDDTPRILPEGCVIEVLEDVEPDDEVIGKLERYRETCPIAVDDFRGRSGRERLLALCDIIKVDVLDMDADRIRSVVGPLRGYGSILLAEKVESREMLKFAGKLGFSLFQGFFFCMPQILTGRKLSSSQVSRLHLLHELEQQEFDPVALAHVIESDVSLSYRLLRYINSPGIGLIAQVKSIRHAVALMGEKRIRQWLRILIMADLNATDRGLELLRLSSMRGYLLQLLAESYPSPMDPDAMFLTGLFSGLDAILDQPMDKILAELPLEDQIKNTLMGEETEARKYLTMAMAMERADWQRLYRLADDLGLKTDRIAGLHTEALKRGDMVIRESLPAGSIEQEV